LLQFVLVGVASGEGSRWQRRGVCAWWG
jgi:hypothetical protein